VIARIGGLTIQHGYATSGVRGTEGGGIYSTGTLAVINCTVTGNAASTDGGAGRAAFYSLGALR